MKRIFLSVISIFMMMYCIAPSLVFAEQFSDNETNTIIEVDIPGVPSTDSKDETVDGGGPNTVILTECGSQASHDNGAGVICILNNAIDILTAGIGILAVLAIVLVGIQYITSGGNEAKMATAKKRIVEVVIGLLIYAVFWAIIKFLVPNFIRNV